MENTITTTLTPFQVLLSLLLPFWIIIFPIIIIRKLNYMTDLLHEYLDGDQEESA